LPEYSELWDSSLKLLNGGSVCQNQMIELVWFRNDCGFVLIDVIVALMHSLLSKRFAHDKPRSQASTLVDPRPTTTFALAHTHAQGTSPGCENYQRAAYCPLADVMFDRVA